MNTLEMDDLFDIMFDETGSLKIASGARSMIDRLRLDITSNANWVLRDTLGIDWINRNNDGFLQLKLSEAFFITEITNKIGSYPDIDDFEVTNYNFDYENRAASIEIRVVIQNEIINLEVNI